MKILFLLLFAATAAHAQQCTTLVYAGAPITSIVNVPSTMPTPFPFTTLVGVVTLNAALVPGTQVVTPIAFDFAPEDARLILPDPNGGSAAGGTHFVSPPPSFSFTVNAAGVITGWDMVINWNTANSGTTANINVNSAQSGDIITYADREMAYNYGGGASSTGSNTTPGTWACLTDLISQATKLPTAQAQVVALTAQLVTANAATMSAQGHVTTLQSQLTVDNVEIATLQKELAAAQAATASAPAAVTVVAKATPAASGGGGALDWLSLLGLAGIAWSGKRRWPCAN